MGDKLASIAAFILILLFAAVSDSLMDTLGTAWFLALGAAIMGAAWALVEVSRA